MRPIKNHDAVSSKDGIIEKFINENEIEFMHLRLFLSARDYVVMTNEEFMEATDYQVESSRTLRES